MREPLGLKKEGGHICVRLLLVHHLFKLVRHSFKLVELILAHLPVIDHVHDYLLWVSLESVFELIKFS